MKVSVEGKYYEDVVNIGFEVNTSSRMVIWLTFPDGTLEDIEFFDISRIYIDK